MPDHHLPPPSFTIRPMREDEPPQCERILRSLPDWFGIEEETVKYCRAVAVMETFVAEIAGEIAGFITLNEHNAYSAEIHVMGVDERQHRQGLGRGLVAHAEDVLRSRSLEFLQVKTLGPSRPNEHYDRTRRFYTSVGFRPLEENKLWGDVNPCLMMIKTL